MKNKKTKNTKQRDEAYKYYLRRVFYGLLWAMIWFVLGSFFTVQEAITLFAMFLALSLVFYVWKFT